ncbi:MAG: site-specific recombinase [Burkholderiales bacterium]|nr:site-specific recombinase [Burkholderiales bacterium]
MAGAAATSTEASGVALERALDAFAGPVAEPPPDGSTGVVDDRITDPVAPFVALFDYIRPRRGETPADAQARYEAVVARLESEPVRAEQVRRHLATLLGTRRLVAFFADSGILPATGFFTELGRIVAGRLLPELPDERELSHAVGRVFHHRADWRWMEAIPPELTLRLWQVLGGDVATVLQLIEPVRDQMLEALLVVAYRVGGLDVEAEFGRLGAEYAGYAVRFRSLASAAQHFADGYRAHVADPGAAFEDEAELLVMVDQCEEVLQRARRASLRSGTSLRMTYLLRRTGQSLQRIATLARLLGLRAGDDSARERRRAALEGWSALVGQSLRAENRRHSVRQHVSEGVSMLALRVTDNAARTGEHYIAGSRGEYFGMWRSAMGAGLLIAAMALIKIFTSAASLPLAAYAFLYSLIYGIGFVIIYMLHMTVATKQPAMTAQTIAGYLGEARQTRAADLERLVDLIAAVARTQFAAILGNVAVALPTAVAFAWGLSAMTGAPVIDRAKAEHLLHDLDPLGWALPHAAVAGVFLFLSGVISGYFDNKASFARLGARVARLRWLAGTVGDERAARIGDYLERHLGGLAGNFLFGCMLGSAGTVGIILGLPIDIRHIAFSSANLGYALVGYGFALPWQSLAWAGLGVTLIGLVNLSVSFALALWMALKARGIAFTGKRALLGRLRSRFVQAPAGFFVVPRAEPSEGAAPAGD